MVDVSCENPQPSTAESGPRILTRDAAVRISEQSAGARRCVVLTNGCFDILHVGHVRYLRQARAFGDILIVGMNTDESVRRLKGSTRPLIPQDDRAEVLASLRCVDYVTLFDEDTAEALVESIQPHVYVKGGDYSLENCPEARIVAGYGGSVEFVQLVEGKSTSAIAAKIAAT